ncbi:MAG TPA: cell wall anchor protein, partial [Micromonospora sp.]
SAHHSEVKVKADCDTATGEWVATWTVNNYAPEDVKHYKFTEVVAKTFVGDQATAASVPGIAVTEGDTYPHDTNTPIVAEQRLPNSTTKASLQVKAKWENGFVEEKWRKATIEFSGTCEKVETPPPATAKPTASVTSDCDGDVAVRLANAEDATMRARFIVTGADGFEERKALKPGEETVVTVPAKNAAKIKVVEIAQDEPLFDGTPEPARDCVEPGEPAGSYRSTCDELVFEVANPEDGRTVEVTFTPNKGEAKKLTVAPGETKSVSFKAFAGLTVTPSAEGMDETGPIAWEKPADCQAGGGGGGEPGLPVTGTAAASIAVGAVVLLAVGVTLFLVARRRRVNFIA